MENTTAVAKIGFMPYQAEVQAGNHSIQGDEPLHLGGGNTGPSPFDLLAASLAQCTVTTLRMYADRKGWKVGHITCEVTMQYERNVVTAFRKNLAFEFPCTEDQEKRMVKIASKCPVHLLLLNEKEITTQIISEKA